MHLFGELAALGVWLGGKVTYDNRWAHLIRHSQGIYSIEL